MDRTLYLSEGSGSILVRRDGPSVWVVAKERAGRRVPARLLGSVVVIGNVLLDAGAIRLFAEHAIPVVFLTRRADEVAVTIPYNHKLPTHYEEQKVFLENESKSGRYLRWVEAKRMILQVRAMRRLLPERAREISFGLGEGNYQALLQSLKPHDEERWGIVSDIVGNLFRGIITERLIRADLDPHCGVMHRRHNFGLALDVCYILGAESDSQCLQLFRSSDAKRAFERSRGNLQLSDTGARCVIQRFENRRRAIHRLIELVIDELFELMRELRA